MPSILISALILWGCQTTPPDPALAASGTLDEARCAELDGEAADACRFALIQLKGDKYWGSGKVDCTIFALPTYEDQCRMTVIEERESIHHGLDRAGICDGVHSDILRWECHFQVLESQSDTLDPVSFVRLCQERTGKLQANCFTHTVNRWRDSLVTNQGTVWFSEAHLDEQIAALSEVVTEESAPIVDMLGFALNSMRNPDGWREDCERIEEASRRSMCLNNPFIGNLPSGVTPRWAGEELETWW